LSLPSCTWFNQLKRLLCWSNGFIYKPPFGTKHRTELAALTMSKFGTPKAGNANSNQTLVPDASLLERTAHLQAFLFFSS
jgi:hypothetical protein